MMDYLNLALTYGGFTGLDRAYISRILERLSDTDKLLFLTPPPSVINAYFAELYEKEGPSAATAYFFELSKALDLFQTTPSFAEEKPFIRLNLSGEAYGFCYDNHEEIAQVFPEVASPVTENLLFELAQLFPHYVIYHKENTIYMKPRDLEEVVIEAITIDGASYPLSEAERLASGTIRLTSFNRDEVLALKQTFTSQVVYYSYSQRAFSLYLQP